MTISVNRADWLFRDFRHEPHCVRSVNIVLNVHQNLRINLY